MSDLMQSDKSRPVQVIGKRKWFYVLVSMTVIPALLLGFLELALRVSRFGYRTGYFIERGISGSRIYVDNPEFGYRFFPRRLARQPMDFAISADKPPETYRIFVLGGSAARGDPSPAFGFSRILEVLLRDKYPDIHFEIINTAMVAVNSHVVLPIARECVKHQPDLLIVYMGNNEFVGPFGAGTVFAPFLRNLLLIKASLALKTFRIGQLVESVVQDPSGKDEPIRSWRGMEMVDEKHRLPKGDPRLSYVYDHFRSNLESICRVSSENGTKIIVCTVATNLKDSPPFASTHGPDLGRNAMKRWRQLYQDAIDLQSAGRFLEAFQKYREAEAIDTDYADLHYRLGECLYAVGNYQESRRHYLLARDLDALRFRADRNINEIIRKTTGERTGEGIHQVDVERFFFQESLHGIPGEDLFYEHAHMNFRGNYLVAVALLGEIENLVAADTRLNCSKQYLPLSIEECAVRLALTQWDRYQVTRNLLARISTKPFTNQIGHAERVKHMIETLKELQEPSPQEAIRRSVGKYRRALELNSDDEVLHHNFARLLLACNDFRTAEKHLRKVIELLPESHEAHYDLGVALMQQEEFEEASEEFKQALRIYPEFTDAVYNLAVACEKLGDQNGAIAFYKRVLELDPFYADAHYNLAGLFSARELLDASVEHYRKALEINPGDADAYNNLGVALSRQGKYDEAIDYFSKALEINPRHPTAQKNLLSAVEKLYEK